jgi:hypothetical protein
MPVQGGDMPLKLTYKEEGKFQEQVVSLSVDVNAAVDFIVGNFSPEEIFPESYLSEWAESNGYKKEA